MHPALLLYTSGGSGFGFAGVDSQSQQDESPQQQGASHGSSEASERRFMRNDQPLLQVNHIQFPVGYDLLRAIKTRSKINASLESIVHSRE